jgi:hypothetical protein
MDSNGELSGKQLRVIPYLLGAPSVEEGCKRAHVSKGAVYEWLKDEAFKNELRRQREQLTAIALDTLKAGIAKATVTVVNHLESKRENIKAVIETHTPEEVAAGLRDSHKDALSGIIAIDGKNGAGKSCLAKKLQGLIGGGIVSLDQFVEPNQHGGFVGFLDQTAITTAIERCATPKIIEGVCVLEVLDAIGHNPDILIYVKEIYFGYLWKDEDMLDRDPEEPLEELIPRKALTLLTEQVIRYHNKYRPSGQAQIIFNRHVR